jgi:hypothetical protein
VTGKDTSVIVVDPRVEGRYTELFRHVKCNYLDYDFACVSGRQYCLAMLGFDLPLSEKPFDLVRAASIVVVEFTYDNAWMRSREVFNELAEKVQLGAPAVRIGFDSGGNDVGDLTNSWAPHTQRYMYVFRKEKSISGATT